MSEIYWGAIWSKIQKIENVMYFYYLGKFAKSETAVSFFCILTVEMTVLKTPFLGLNGHSTRKPNSIAFDRAIMRQFWNSRKNFEFFAPKAVLFLCNLYIFRISIKNIRKWDNLRGVHPYFGAREPYRKFTYLTNQKPDTQDGYQVPLI